MASEIYSVKVAVSEAVVDGHRVHVNAAENALVWLLKHKAIDATLFAAGEKLREDFTFAGMEQRMTSSWDEFVNSGARGRGGATLNYSEARIAALARFNRAIAAVGLELSDILIEVCCHASGLEQVERRLKLPPRAGKAVLKLALTALARHYGLLRQRRAAGMVHAALPDYRPELKPAPPPRPA